MPFSDGLRLPRTAKVARNADNVLTRIRESGQGFGLILNSDVRVLHRHFDVGVPGKLHRLRKRGPVAEQSGYLFEGLRKAGVRVGLVHGGVADEERTALRKRFEKEKADPDAIDVLLFSEVGCEGLDYQFCDCMINYDLPWNPMRVEQRIGRIDRNGQKSEFVSIYNLITPGTVDADIYERCLLRIGIFEQALGASEDILGKITADIQEIAIDPKLSEEERRNKLQQLADNEIRLLQEEQRLEEQQSELFGINLPAARSEPSVKRLSGVAGFR